MTAILNLYVTMMYERKTDVLIGIRDVDLSTKCLHA